ncbi:MAG: M56 family metallopeptidase [Gemmatimonadales bacterium]
MIAAWMLYCVGIALAFVVVGYALERGLHLAGRPTRWAWMIALAGSCLVPVAAWVRPDAFATLTLPVPERVGSPSSVLPTSPSTNAARAAAASSARAFSLSDLDALFSWSWGLSSAMLLLVLTVAAFRLASLRRRWRASRVDGRLVLVSRDVGPAVVGLWRPRVVIPEWALVLPPKERALMLAHEEQHVRTRDPWLLALGAVAVLLAPWNAALWWQVRRLRLAVEMDCDARVLARGGSAPTYGELLLEVGRRRAKLPLGAPAFGEPASFLERRIRRIVTGLPRGRWAGAALAFSIAAGAVVAACETPRPFATSVAAAQNPTELTVQGPGVSSAQVRPLLTRYFGANAGRLADSAVIAWFVVDKPGRVVAWGTAPWMHRDSVLSTMTAARAIPRYDTLQVSAVLVHAERGLPPTVVVRIGDRATKIGWAPIEGSPPSNEGPVGRRPAGRAEDVRRLARQYHPEALVRPLPGAAVALVLDSQYRVLAHAAGVRQPRDQSCMGVLTRLVPEFSTARFPVSGCADFDRQRTVVVYWGIVQDR